jgi:ribosomal protein L3
VATIRQCSTVEAKPHHDSSTTAATASTTVVAAVPMPIKRYNYSRQKAADQQQQQQQNQQQHQQHGSVGKVVVAVQVPVAMAMLDRMGNNRNPRRTC